MYLFCRYGETNMHFVNYRLSDIREFKEQALDRIPIYTPEHDNRRSLANSISKEHDINIHVPIFKEILNGGWVKHLNI